MLVVKRVPLQLFEKVPGIHELQAKVTVTGKHDICCVENLLGAVVMRERVAPRHYIDGTVPVDDLFGNVCIEKSSDYIQALRPGQIGDILRNVYSDRMCSGFLKRREKYAIVAPE